MTLGSLFDGIGGFPYAASFYGVRSLWASEIVPECVSVTRHHFPDMVPVGDITQLHGGTLPPVDIITFGSPCQGLSLAGLRRGLADERSGLFMEAIRIIYEMKEATHGKYPRFAIWENVPGCTSSAHGRDFAAVLSALTKSEVPMPRSGRWANAGMVRGVGVDLAWVIYDSQHFGTAQRRRRVFLVCDFGGKRAGEILFVPKSLRRYFEAGGTPQQGLAAFAENGADAAGGVVDVLNDHGRWFPVGTAQRRPSRQARPGGSMNVERTGVSPTLRSQTHGNLPIVAAGIPGPVGINGDIAGTLDASYYKGTGSRGNQERDVVLCTATGQSRAEILHDPAPTPHCGCGRPYIVHPRISGTLCASGAGLSRPAGMGSELDFCVASAGFRYKAGSAAGSVGYQEETAPTLVAGQPSGILSILSNWALIVRRLTPLEAERLMGFPDFWTQYGHDGREISDSKRYSMLGNSIAVPCVAYIMQGVRDVLLREEAQ